MVKEYRRARFKQLLEGRFKGNRAALCEAAELTNGRLTQLLDPEEPFGDTAARRLVDKLKLPRNYFDPPLESGVLSKEALLVAKAYENMTPDERRRLDHLMAAALDIDLTEPHPKSVDLGNLSDFGDLDDGGHKTGTK